MPKLQKSQNRKKCGNVVLDIYGSAGERTSFFLIFESETNKIKNLHQTLLL